MKFKKYLLYGFVGIMIWGLLHVSAILMIGLGGHAQEANAILIFGNKVETSGQVSPRLKSRLDEGAKLFKEGVAPVVVVSGGLGKEGFDEAVVMKNYLVGQGVKEEAIILDQNGNNTYQTASNLKKIAENQNINSVVIVTQYYHVLRAKYTLYKFGFNPVYSSHAKMFPELRDLYSIPREVVGYYSYLIKDYSINQP